MIESPTCPVCQAAAWERIGSQTYRRDDSGLSAYTRKRYEILFDLWAVGQSTFEAVSALCEDCGLVLYTPRPTADEISAKYARLGGATSSTVKSPVVTPIDRRRSEEMFEAVAAHLPATGSIMDYGGGSGGLMVGFAERGYACSVVDYAPETIPGVDRIATTLDELPDDCLFDFAIASHVIEHVPDPLAAVRALGAHLKPDGCAYIEVPMELVGGPPDRRDPVTHINFFAEASMGELIRRAGLTMERCWTAATIHAQGHRMLSICALAKPVATPGDVTGMIPGAAAAGVRQLVELGPAGRAAYLLRFPNLLLNPALRFVARRRG